MSKSLEVRIDDWVLSQMKELGLTYYQQNDLPSNYIESLKGASKSGKGTGKPDFCVSIDKENRLAVIIENKWGLNKLEHTSKTGYTGTTKAVKEYAVNGVLHYGYKMLQSDEFDEIIAIAVAGEGSIDEPQLATKVFYMFDAQEEPKELFDGKTVTDFSFLKEENFDKFYTETTLTDEEKHRVLIKSYADLKATAKKLNVLMNNNSITVDQRVVYVSGMLLSMSSGLKPDRLEGLDPSSTRSDGKLIYTYIEDFLIRRKVETKKAAMMLSIFNTLRVDGDRDLKRTRQIKPKTGELENECSINKEIFEFIYYNVFLKISEKTHIDTLGEMYSEFLKYALGDGKENGIVLTPPYVTKAMNKLIGVDRNSHLLDLCTGSGGFLVSGMTAMIEDAKETMKYGDPKELATKIEDIKKRQLLGVELDLKMFTLATTNMILRGDGSSTIYKDSAFNVVKGEALRVFKADKCLLNPPFSYSENGMPFALEALNAMEKGGTMGIIIQDSAGSGRAVKTNKLILRDHTLVASITMPSDLFQPNAGVQTSIYIIEAGTPHDFRKKVRFIDFSNDGYKRTGRGLREIDNPEQKYKDLLDVYISGDSIGDTVCVDDQINDSGDDWNYNSHLVFDTVPTEEDFIETVGQYLQFEISQLLKGDGWCGWI